MEIADNGCCCLRVAVSCGAGGAGIDLWFVDVASVDECIISKSMGGAGGGGGGGRGEFVG